MNTHDSQIEYTKYTSPYLQKDNEKTIMILSIFQYNYSKESGFFFISFFCLVYILSTINYNIDHSNEFYKSHRTRIWKQNWSDCI